MSRSTTDDIIESYRRRAPELIERFGGLSADRLLGPIVPYLPPAPATILEVGAGPGRDARWFADNGYGVTAVEPVDAFRAAGQALTGGQVEWIDDTLPDLLALELRSRTFDVVYVMAVWQHLPPEHTRRALMRLATLTSAGGYIILSLRFGSGHPDRPVFPIDLEDTKRTAAELGLELAGDLPAHGLQTKSTIAGTTWRWLVLRKPDHSTSGKAKT